jgi:peptidyl-prolyl cis-trans isomerase A (cyclophilin A)
MHSEHLGCRKFAFDRLFALDRGKNMAKRKPMWAVWIVAALVVFVGIVGAGIIAGHAQAAPSSPAAGSSAGSAAPATDREPGLYWIMQTDMGTISCKLLEKEAPVTVGKMVGLAIGKLSYVDSRTKQTVHKKFFDGLTFHRVIPNFMIQGGDPLGNGTGSPEGPGFPYKNETAPGLNFDMPGRLAMANAGPNTNGSQFFITEVANPSLNGGYTIWGQCDNPDVVKAIARVKRDSNDKPVTAVHIVHVTVQRVGPAPANAPEVMSSSGAAKKEPAPASAARAPSSQQK